MFLPDLSTYGLSVRFEQKQTIFHALDKRAFSKKTQDALASLGVSLDEQQWVKDGFIQGKDLESVFSFDSVWTNQPIEYVMVMNPDLTQLGIADRFLPEGFGLAVITTKDMATRIGTHYRPVSNVKPCFSMGHHIHLAGNPDLLEKIHWTTPVFLNKEQAQIKEVIPEIKPTDVDIKEFSFKSVQNEHHDASEAAMSAFSDLAKAIGVENGYIGLYGKLSLSLVPIFNGNDNDSFYIPESRTIVIAGFGGGRIANAWAMAFDHHILEYCVHWSKIKDEHSFLTKMKHLRKPRIHSYAGYAIDESGKSELLPNQVAFMYNLSHVETSDLVSFTNDGWHKPLPVSEDDSRTRYMKTRVQLNQSRGDDFWADSSRVFADGFACIIDYHLNRMGIVNEALTGDTRQDYYPQGMEKENFSWQVTPLLENIRRNSAEMKKAQLTLEPELN